MARNDPSSSKLAGTGLALDVLRGIRRNARSWARQTFTREQFWNAGKSLAWIAPLTVLIWIYAEREQIRPPVRQTIPITIRTSDQRQVVTIIKPDREQSILADLQGPQQAIEGVMASLSRPNEGGAVITLPNNATGEREIPTSLIRESELFRNSGVTISNETPQTLLVRVDKLVEESLEVRTPEGMENFNSPPVYTPSSVKVTLPETLMNSLMADGTLVAVAELGRFEAIRQPGPHKLPDVPVTIVGLKNASNYTIDPPRVTADLDVRNAERQIKLDSLSIWPLYPPGVQGKYVAKMDEQFIRNIVITGPRDVIDQIEANEREGIKFPGPRPKAILDVDQEDVGRGKLTRNLRFDFPPSVKVTDSKNKTVSFELLPADTGNPGQ